MSTNSPTPLDEDELKEAVRIALSCTNQTASVEYSFLSKDLVVKGVDLNIKELSQEIQSAKQQAVEEERYAIFKTLKQDKELSNELPHPIDAIEFVMEQRNLTQNDLIPYFGSKSRVSEVLNKVRPLSKKMIRRLMAGLDISAEVLIQEYELTGKEQQ